MRLARISIALTALAYFGFGIACLLKPELLETLGIAMLTPAARVEIRGFYGGLEIGFGVFFAIALTRPSWFQAALTAQSASLGALVIGRLIGTMIDGWPGRPLVFLWAMEIAACTIGLIALRRLNRTEPVPLV